jgi:molybdopterin synthase catalytic subunit
MMFELTDQPIFVKRMETLDKRAGGFVSFEGRVRSVNEGKTVTGLEYEVYTALALTEGQAIVQEAVTKFGLFAAYGVHRHGALALGETAVWVWAAAMHRREAFEGAEYIIHAIKHRLPVWKKEWYADGSFAWVNCQHGAHE